jgi:hypothetical protein
MKSHFLFFLLPIIISFTSCGNDPSEVKTDSIPKKDSSVLAQNITRLDTDSGKLEIISALHLPESKATLYYPDGKVKASGFFIGGKPASAWIYYDEKGNIIKAEHISNNEKARPLDKTDFEFRDWSSQTLGLKFKLPKNWKELTSPNPNLIASFYKDVQADSVKIKPSFNVARAQIGPGDSLSKLTKDQLDLLYKQYGRVEINDEQYFTINSCKAFRRYGLFYTENSKIGFLNAIIIHGKDAWLFSFEAQNMSTGEFLQYQGLFEMILQSFERVE